MIEHPIDTLLAQLPDKGEVRCSEGARRDSFHWQVDQFDADLDWLRLREGLAIISQWPLLVAVATWLKPRMDAWHALAWRDFLYDRLARTLGPFISDLYGPTAHPFDAHLRTARRLHNLGVTSNAESLTQARRVPNATNQAWFSQLINTTPFDTSLSTLTRTSR